MDKIEQKYLQAVEIISAQLKNDLPGLMGFGVTSLKNMRKFYEAWATIEDKSATGIAEFWRIPSQRIYGCPVFTPYPHFGKSERQGRKTLLFKSRHFLI